MSIVDEIEDERLKQDIDSMGLTVPHPQSVLSPEMATYHKEMYVRLAAMEAYTYQKSEQVTEIDGAEPAGMEQYQPYWEPYNDAVMAYLKSPVLSKQAIKDFLIGFYCFMSVHKGRGMGDVSLIERSDAKYIFDGGGYYEEVVKGWTLDHFDDYIPPDPTALPEPIEESVEALTAAPSSVVAYYDTDVSEVKSLNTQFADVVSDAGILMAFSNPTPPQGGLSPTEMWDLVFDELNWQWYVETFGVDFEVPARPENLT